MPDWCWIVFPVIAILGTPTTVSRIPGAKRHPRLPGTFSYRGPDAPANPGRGQKSPEENIYFRWHARLLPLGKGLAINVLR